ncbi:MAG: hypothetical protein AB1488_06095 [Nitrospirota bacterium]
MAVQLTDLDVKKKSSFIGSSQFQVLFSKETKEILPPLKWVEEGKQFDYFLYFLRREIFRYPEQEAWTQTLDVQIDYKDFYTFIGIKPWFKKELEPRELEQEALLSIVSKFSEVEKIKSIYVQRYREEIQIYILLSITQYDSDLMDILLDIEYDIRKRYPELVFEFFYPPAGISDKKDFIHPQAQCIYAR